MGWDALDWARQRRQWASLSALHATTIDLERIALIREADARALADTRFLESLLPRLGLNDEAIDEIPAGLRPHCGQGLRIWQYPRQFAPYLAALSQRGVRSYLEIGIRHGGSFVATTEVLERFHPLELAVGVDVIPCPSMAAYQRRNPKARFWCMNTRAPAFAAALDELGAIDLVFIDSHHEETQCRSELEIVAAHARMIAFHDIANVGCPGVGRVWQEVKRSPGYECFEYIEQYEARGPFMGIGLAIKR